MIYRLCPPAALLAVLLIPSAQATNFFVASNADSGAGSLRTAINSANATPNGTHTITFGSAFPAGGTIALLSTLPTIAAQSLTINGGNRAPVISGQNAHQILRVSGTNTSLEIRNLEFRDGWATQNGGCIYDASFAAQTVGVLYLSQVAFSGCSVSASSLASGGAIYWIRNQGLLTIAHSRFSANSVDATTSSGTSMGGAITVSTGLSIIDSLFKGNFASVGGKGGSGGALHLSGSGQEYQIRGSTFLGNVASPSVDPSGFGHGGAISQDCDACSLKVESSYFRGNAGAVGGAIFARRRSSAISTVVLSLINSSFVNNSAVDAGGAAWVRDVALTMGNSTFYNNDAASGAHLAFGRGTTVYHAVANLLGPAISGPACSGTAGLPSPERIAANLLADSSCVSLAAGALPNGPLGTITLDEPPGAVGVVRFTGSAVIDSISDPQKCLWEDARMSARPIDGDGDGIAHCDVGAYEHPHLVLLRDGFEG